MGAQAAAQNNLLRLGHWGKVDACGPSVQVVTTSSNMKLSPTRKGERKKASLKGKGPGKYTMHLITQSTEVASVSLRSYRCLLYTSDAADER